MRRTGWIGAAKLAIDVWALAGGVLLLAVVAINVFSVLGGIFWKPFPGDFELTEIGVAVAAFSFLPYCQLRGANVTADIFTARASTRWIAIFRIFAAAAAIVFAALLLWRMYAGMLSQKEYGYTTAILQVPIWCAYVPILVSLALLFVAAAISFSEGGFGLNLRKRA
ncbi:MAG: TRAP transporter small permease subunit [Albidovulum sp.]|nr:TRAP transporter small permease subunit [Albidovulum sp.]